MATKGPDKDEQLMGTITTNWETAQNEQYFHNFYYEAMRQLDQPFRNISPYWLELPIMQECNVGNAIGKAIDDEEKFAVEIDVSQFMPQELSVNVRGRELVIEAHQIRRADEVGSIERHFVRRYTLPDDTRPDGITSHLSNTGVLSVSTPKFNDARQSHGLHSQTHSKDEAKQKCGLPC
uniref:SHSP domain-containing protein n=1 Tax=Parascaris univalens TaxID=6257 RepID=A0A915AX32_PARUN